jgi:hypothetical protein
MTQPLSRVPVALQLMWSAGQNVYVLDHVVAEESEKGRAFLEKAKSMLSADAFKRVNRFTFVQPELRPVAAEAGAAEGQKANPATLSFQPAD